VDEKTESVADDRDSAWLLAWMACDSDRVPLLLVSPQLYQHEALIKHLQ
jgi:hypothetical protein